MAGQKKPVNRSRGEDLVNRSGEEGIKEENMGKFSDDAAKLLAYVGGKENINAITHCVTRMRFVLLCLPSREHSHRPDSSR